MWRQDGEERPPVVSHPGGRTPVNPRTITVVVVVAVVCYLVAFTLAMRYLPYDLWGALWVAPVLVAVSLPVIARFARREADPAIGRLLIFALVVKLAASFARYYMAFGVYGTGDSMRYAQVATELRREFLSGDFSFAALGTDSRTGTQFLEIVAGVVYTAVGPSVMAGFLVFSWLGFWGLYFFYRAFRVALPDGDNRRYALVLFFLPSMLFWPSSIGKEAFMLLALGITSYGCARLLSRARGASVYLVLGFAGILMLRPHVALVVIAGLVLAYAVRANRMQRMVAMSKLRTILGLAVIGAVTLVAAQQVATFFGVDEFNVDTATETMTYTEGQTSQGGSEFEGGGPSLVSMPQNLITVLFRPFPFEVHNVQSLLTALEGTVLLGLFFLSASRFRSIPGRLRRQPYIAFAITYALVFCFVFSSFNNFGILARERVMVYPIVLVLIALPVPPRRGHATGIHEPTASDALSSAGASSGTGAVRPARPPHRSILSEQPPSRLT